MSDRSPHKRAKPSAMRVYAGAVAVGEIEDWGPGDIRAFDLTPSGRRVAVGVYTDRKAAMRAVGRRSEREGPK